MTHFGGITFFFFSEMNWYKVSFVILLNHKLTGKFVTSLCVS
jgi:hypothetical protein